MCGWFLSRRNAQSDTNGHIPTNRNRYSDINTSPNSHGHPSAFSHRDPHAHANAGRQFSDLA